MSRDPVDPTTTAQARFAKGRKLHGKGELGRAGELYRQALALQPQHFEALHQSAVLAAQSGNPRQAVALFEQAVRANPGHAVAFYNRGNALLELKEHRQAADSYDRALVLMPRFPEAHFNRARALIELGLHQEAIESYDRAIAQRPDYVRAVYNRGNALREVGRPAEAVASYDRVVALDPRHVDAHLNRATTLRDLKRLPASIAGYRRTIELAADHADAWASLGLAYVDVKDFAAAAQSFDKAIALGSRVGSVHGNRLHARMHLCDWRTLDADLADLAVRIERGDYATEPFALLARCDSSRLHRRAAEIFIASRKARLSAPLDPVTLHDHARIRIGYYSADFQNHATAYLTAELFERHDRDRFEITAFSFGPDQDDEMRRRLNRAFDRFVDVRARSDREVALLSRELGIDIAVDLKGYTGDGRPGIFAYRAAPVQIAWLGYPGTTGAPAMDYLLADRTLIPVESRQHYSEKIVTLPGTYEVNDTRRAIADRRFARRELGLPEQGFVFCCFNASFKIMPATFERWMRLLRHLDGSVLSRGDCVQARWGALISFAYPQPDWGGE